MKAEAKNAPYLLERIFKIRKTENIVDLSDSFTSLNKEKFARMFDAEIYKVTFSTEKLGQLKNFDLFLSCNELICNEEIENLNQSLGIIISGDGSHFEILDYETDFTIQFDQENSSFINSDEVEEGLIVFRKQPDNYQKRYIT